MEIAKTKTELQHAMNQPRVSETTEDEVDNLSDELKVKFICENCVEGSTLYGLSVHKGKHCKERKLLRIPAGKVLFLTALSLV